MAAQRCDLSKDTFGNAEGKVNFNTLIWLPGGDKKESPFLDLAEFLSILSPDQ